MNATANVADRPVKVSVVIPVFNQQRYLGACLDTVVNQTLRDIEILCVDDGSTDGSGAILDEAARRDDRIQVIHQVNAGPGPARNAALDRARGDYICFMDPDDRYPAADVLERLYTSVHGSGCQVAGGFARCFPYDDPVAVSRDRKGLKFCAFPRFGIVEFREYQVAVRFWCYIYARDLIARHRFPALLFVEDMPFFVEVMRDAGRFLALDVCTYEYRQHSGNNSRVMSPERIRDRFAAYRRLFDVAVEADYQSLCLTIVGSTLAWRRRCRIGVFRFAFLIGVSRLPLFTRMYIKYKIARKRRMKDEQAGDVAPCGAEQGA